MDATDPQSLLLLLLPLMAATGFVAGILAGLLGVGGGIVIVPMLYYVFDFLDIDAAVRMHVAVGTSLATIVATSIRSMRAHQIRDSFDAAVFRDWTPGVVAGVLAGSWLASIASYGALVLVFASVASLVALQMALGRPQWQLRDRPPAGAAAWPVTVPIGAISALMGIGGGTMSVTVLTLCGMPIHRAVGTAAAFGLVIAVPGAISFVIAGWGQPGLPPWSLGFVNLPAFALIVPLTVLAAPLGARLAHSLDPVPLRRVFAAFLGLTALRMFADVGGLI